MEHYRFKTSYTPKTRAEIISDTVDPTPPLPKFNMPHMSSMDATYHAARDQIYALLNPAPTNYLVKLGNGKKGSI